MAEAHHTEETYHEMDLGDIIRELYAHKWVLMGATLLIGILAAVYTLQMPNTYEASAALIVQEPENAVIEDIPSLNVETLRTMAGSTEVIWTLFTKLWDGQMIPEWQDKPQDKMDVFRRFQSSLSTHLTKQETRAGNSITLLPIVVLKAKAQSPESAEIMANQWTGIVSEKSKVIYEEGVNTLSNFIGGMYQESKSTLQEYEETLSETKLKAGLDLKQVRLSAIKTKSTGLEESVFDLSIEMAVNKVLIEEGKKRIQQQQWEGEWLGTFAEATYLAGKEVPLNPEELGGQSQKILHLVQRKISHVQALRAYRRESALLVKEKEFEYYQEALKNTLTQKAEMEDALPGIKATVTTLSKQLEDIPERISLNKAITDDALWNGYINNSLPENETITPLKTEILNSVHQTTLTQLVKATAQQQETERSIEQLAEKEAVIAEHISRLESELEVITQDIARMEKELETTKTTLDTLYKDYLAEILQVETLTLENIRNQEEFNVKEQQRQEIAASVGQLEEDVLSFELKIEELNREIDKTKNVQSALASKAEEVAVLQVSLEQASNTGTAILYNAQANPAKVGPSRSRIVLASMVGAFTLCALLILGAQVINTKE